MSDLTRRKQIVPDTRSVLALYSAYYLDQVSVKVEAAAIAFEDNSLREAADQVVREGIGRLPVVTRENPRKVPGWPTRSDLLPAHGQRLKDTTQITRHLEIPTGRPDSDGAATKNPNAGRQLGVEFHPR